MSTEISVIKETA